MPKRVTESEIANAVKAYLNEAGGSATIGQIRRAIPKYLPLDGLDRTPSRTRPGEEVWEQQVRNIVCHRDCEGNPVKAGEISYSRHRLTLSDGPQGELFN